jgi:hypothetical protein
MALKAVPQPPEYKEILDILQFWKEIVMLDADCSPTERAETQREFEKLLEFIKPLK